MSVFFKEDLPVKIYSFFFWRCQQPLVSTAFDCYIWSRVTLFAVFGDSAALQNGISWPVFANSGIVKEITACNCNHHFMLQGCHPDIH